DMQAIQADHMSRPGKVFTDIIATVPTTASSPPELATAQAIFAQWAMDGWDCPSGLLGSDPANSPVDPDPKVSHSSSACFLFHDFARVLATNVFADDLAVAGQDVDGLQAMKAMIFMLQPGLPAAATTFCNDVSPRPAAHTCMEQVAKALVIAVDTLTAQV